jgi:hypothetical protein
MFLSQLNLEIVAVYCVYWLLKRKNPDYFFLQIELQPPFFPPRPGSKPNMAQKERPVRGDFYAGIYPSLLNGIA